MGYFLKGYPSDMSCWIAWGNKVLNGGMGHFYAPDYFCDYPPGYITVLGFFAWINEIFGLTENATQLCFKLPGIFSDAILMASIFVIGSKHMSKKSALFLGIIYMLNPLMIVNSAAWGQAVSYTHLDVYKRQGSARSEYFGMGENGSHKSLSRAGLHHAFKRARVAAEPCADLSLIHIYYSGGALPLGRGEQKYVLSSLQGYL